MMRGATARMWEKFVSIVNKIEKQETNDVVQRFCAAPESSIKRVIRSSGKVLQKRKQMKSVRGGGDRGWNVLSLN